MAKVTGRTNGLISGTIDRCKFFPTTVPSDPILSVHFLCYFGTAVAQK